MRPKKIGQALGRNGLQKFKLLDKIGRWSSNLGWQALSGSIMKTAEFQERIEWVYLSVMTNIVEFRYLVKDLIIVFGHSYLHLTVQNMQCGHCDLLGCKIGRVLRVRITYSGIQQNTRPLKNISTQSSNRKRLLVWINIFEDAIGQFDQPL